MNQLLLIIFGTLLPWSNGFQTIVEVRRNVLFSRGNVGSSKTLPPPSLTALFHKGQLCSGNSKRSSVSRVSSLFRSVRLDTISATGLKNVHTAGGGVYMLGIKSAGKVINKAKSLPEDIRNFKLSDVDPKEVMKSLHGPITYLILSFLFARKFPSMFKNMFYWLWVAFCIKWFRARYVFKIPVWDRQPNWNNIITSKEQEKDLKAFTCKTCGSTIFIAKTREFFFEGSTGIGGLGCFSCGAKGADNFVMDRDRIVEDVADIDDYFEYERPLDFISAAERRKVLKETGGDEDAANKLLVERENAQASTESQAAADAVVNGATGKLDSHDDDSDNSSVIQTEPDVKEIEEEEIDTVAPPKAEKKVTKPTPSALVDDDDIDILDMDDF
mmetsp:Transcript_18704/g.38355  ORF Transcript_18704/g.38355 Transcript_18704/m.38355 type:complete len:385 (-) Transcript_18704:92-1246(-)|eukprot:CAMPEP_0201120538 /NCGR_PEP_ID=MMETSP0850-20130426/4592_1 /ASSEMBLY_ACC=CAM_ASM_000622 /TAXON_ID=183588 /ORGANISM="Pseudo-nitzschia fraudulenta, Strain WWA7" /LENGTH=384 /DNA_ID=CAMNT_0047386723 /DNA_START=171 /DNA_END=1325 /DNA_ORIENTATION=-